MSHNIAKEQKKDCDNKRKRSLKKILSEFLQENKIDEKILKRLKKEFFRIKLDMNSKNSYEVLSELQKKLKKIYRKINEEENSEE